MKNLPLFAFCLLLPTLLTAGEIVERVYTNSRGEPVQIKVFTPSSQSSSSSSYHRSRPSTRSYRSTGRNGHRTIIHGGYHPASYSPYSYAYSGYGYSRYQQSCRVPYRPSISVRGTSSRTAFSIRHGR